MTGHVALRSRFVTGWICWQRLHSRDEILSIIITKCVLFTVGK